ncbi:MAG: hypothetical protein JWP10_129 [Nocardioidaceae bacterium]|nr:hypothetical protein [Nocardioidaceae bacterium]
MTGSWRHRDADDFAAALDGAVPVRRAIRDLVRTAEDVCAAAAVTPSAEFTDSLRARLMTEARDVLVVERIPPRTAAPPLTSPSKARRRIAAVVGALVMCGGAVGIASASANTVPGDILYPVKRGLENTSLALKRSDADRGAFQLERATRRLNEAKQLAATGDASDERQIAQTIDEFSEQAQEGSDQLFSDFSNNGDDAAIDKVYAFASDSSDSLSTLSGLVPADASAAVSDAAEALITITQRAGMLCAACGSGAQAKSLESGLRGSVAKVLKGGGVPPSSNSKSDQGGSTTSPQAGSPSAGVPAIPAPTKVAPTTPAPTTDPAPTPPAATPSNPISGLVDPLIDGLLGDDGLIPGLLDPSD